MNQNIYLNLVEVTVFTVMIFTTFGGVKLDLFLYVTISSKLVYKMFTDQCSVQGKIDFILEFIVRLLILLI